MECGHVLESGHQYEFSHDGSCDNCAALHVVPFIAGIYIGEALGGHHFELLTPYSCLGCHGTVTHVTHLCRGINVTQEMQTSRREK